jgi:hypothetical protein
MFSFILKWLMFSIICQSGLPIVNSLPLLEEHLGHDMLEARQGGYLSVPLRSVASAPSLVIDISEAINVASTATGPLTVYNIEGLRNTTYRAWHVDDAAYFEIRSTDPQGGEFTIGTRAAEHLPVTERTDRQIVSRSSGVVIFKIICVEYDPVWDYVLTINMVSC